MVFTMQRVFKMINFAVNCSYRLKVKLSGLEMRIFLQTGWFIFHSFNVQHDSNNHRSVRVYSIIVKRKIKKRKDNVLGVSQLKVIGTV